MFLLYKFEYIQNLLTYTCKLATVQAKNNERSSIPGGYDCLLAAGNSRQDHIAPPHLNGSSPRLPPDMQNSLYERHCGPIRANNTTSPSEFLTGVTLDTKRLEAIRKIANDCKYGCEPIMMPTVWTWLQIPEDLTIEDPYSKVGKRWAKLLGDFRVRSEQIVDLWGRVSERRGVVCLVHREWRLLPPNLH